MQRKLGNNVLKAAVCFFICLFVFEPIGNSSIGFFQRISVAMQGPPTGFTLSQSTRSRTFTVGWTAGSGNGGATGCRIEYQKNDGTWSTVGSPATVNCDAAGSASGTISLPTGTWQSDASNWSGRPVRLIRVSDSSVLGSIGTLSCSVTSGSPTATPDIDEDCNGAWDNSVSTYTCPSINAGGSCTGAAGVVAMVADTVGSPSACLSMCQGQTASNGAFGGSPAAVCCMYKPGMTISGAPADCVYQGGDTYAGGSDTAGRCPSTPVYK